MCKKINLTTQKNKTLLHVYFDYIYYLSASKTDLHCTKIGNDLIDSLE